MPNSAILILRFYFTSLKTKSADDEEYRDNFFFIAPARSSVPGKVRRVFAHRGEARSRVSPVVLGRPT